MVGGIDLDLASEPSEDVRDFCADSCNDFGILPCNDIIVLLE